MRRTVAVLFLAVVALGVSQAPSPGRSKNGSGPQQQATKEPRGTELSKNTARTAVPVPSVSAIGDAYKQGYDAGKKDAQSGPDVWTMLADASPLIVGLMTGGLIWKQILLGRRLNDLTKQSADAATDAAKAAIAGLEASKELAQDSRKDTEASLALTEQAAVAATKGADTAEKALILTERPWIAHVEHGSTTRDGIPRVLVRLTNAGRSPAFMKRWGALVYVEHLPAPALVFRELRKAKSFGAVVPNQIVSIETDLPNDPEIRKSKQLILVSYICYTDIHGLPHKTCDIWMWDNGGWRFTGHPEYKLEEYSLHT